ncbi:MAG: universal stress protein [Alphaproteobacteria bacterium]
MYSKILVPLDGSTLSEGVLPYVRSLARAMKVPVEFLRINDTTQPIAYPTSMHLGEYFEKVKASFSGITEVKHTLELGHPAGMIVDLAAEHPGTLIAMATHGYSGAQRWLLGSVAEKVLHGAKNDLLIVRTVNGNTGGEASLKTLLVPLDGSEEAEKALSSASDLATRLPSKVVLVRVLARFYFAPPETVVPVIGMNIPDPKELRAQEKAQASQYLTDKVEQLRAQGIAQVSSVLIDGGAEGAAADIIDLAGKTPDNVVVMSTHGRSGVGRWLIGSIVERVVRHSSGPVLVIRRQR